MPEENTGYLAYSKLKKVVDGGPYDGQALDDSDHLCSDTGLPQSKKDNNVSDPDYVAPIYDTTSCPVATTTFTLNITNNTPRIPTLEVLDATDGQSVHVAGVPASSTAGPYAMATIDDGGTYTMTLTGVDYSFVDSAIQVNGVVYPPVESSGTFYTYHGIPKEDLSVIFDYGG